VRAIFRHELDDFRAVLTPDQQSTFDRNMEAMRVRAIFRHELDDFRAVLTPDQQSTFDRNMEAMRARRGGR